MIVGSVGVLSVIVGSGGALSVIVGSGGALSVIVVKKLYEKYARYFTLSV